MDEAMEDMATGVKSELLEQAKVGTKSDKERRSIKRIHDHIDVEDAKKTFKKVRFAQSRVPKVLKDIQTNHKHHLSNTIKEPNTTWPISNLANTIQELPETT